MCEPEPVWKAGVSLKDMGYKGEMMDQMRVSALSQAQHYILQ